MSKTPGNQAGLVGVGAGGAAGRREGTLRAALSTFFSAIKTPAMPSTVKKGLSRDNLKKVVSRKAPEEGDVRAVRQTAAEKEAAAQGAARRGAVLARAVTYYPYTLCM